ncbi:hypothetical protein J5X84_12975 [Streptosporangiaceae bacterium NEAU-GS5]|nr:hypothetical protein [Streptosporangiaceae bacterium NEAU-GS5]
MSDRMRLLGEGAAADLVTAMLDLTVSGLPLHYKDGEFVFTRRGVSRPGGGWDAVGEGRSVRYAAIVALGVATLPADRQRLALGGETAADLVSRLVKQLPEVTGLGDTALICWAAAETRHPEAETALRRLNEIDDRTRDATQVYTVEAAWALAAYAAARALPGAAVDDRLEFHRKRMLSGLGADRLYRHALGAASGPLVPWYRSHVGCFADQVYPIQALARLHAETGDADALRVADQIAAGICEAQGEQGQWWWHYDARTGSVVEGYPVYSVHQLSMAPMALLDLLEAGGDAHIPEISLGLMWMLERPESTESLIDEKLLLTWRKVAREDPRKLVRGLKAVASRTGIGGVLGTLDRIYPAVAVDRECRPYELGWLLYAWQ